MSLARAWMRQISGASGIAVLVPAAIFASMVLLALAGGFGQLGGLGQAVAGPTAPTGAGATSSPTASGGGSSPAGAALLPVVTRSGALLVASVPSVGAGGPGRASGPGGPQNGSHLPKPPSSPPTLSVTPPTKPPAPPPPTTSTPPAGGAPTLVDQVVSLGTSLTSKIPGPVGQLATSLLNNLGKTVDRVLPLPALARSAQAPVASAVSALQSGMDKLGSAVGQVGSTVNHLLPGVHLP